jgi:hypothetical protein
MMMGIPINHSNIATSLQQKPIGTLSLIPVEKKNVLGCTTDHRPISV